VEVPTCRAVRGGRLRHPGRAEVDLLAGRRVEDDGGTVGRGTVRGEEVTMAPFHRLAAGSLVCALALAGCTDEPDPAPSPSPSASATTTTASAEPTPTASSPAPTTASVSPTTTTQPTAPAGFSLDGRTSPTFPDLGGDLGGLGTVRVGHHTGYDRVVWEFAGSGRPTYRVRYVDEPLADGSGDPVPVEGEAYVEVLVSTVGIPPEGTARPDEAPASALSGTVIAQALPVYGGFEGYGQAFVGVRDTRRPLRVATLTNPTRLVVDVFTG
jgi:hypothetical protein